MRSIIAKIWRTENHSGTAGPVLLPPRRL
jgi:hypothetical protein